MNEVFPLNESAWAEWLEWRQKEKKIKVGPIAAKKQTQKLCRYPPNIQQMAVDHSIENSYQGLFPEKFVRNAPERNTRATSLREDLTSRDWAK